LAARQRRNYVSAMDIPAFVWYIRALEVKGQAFRQPFAHQNSTSIHHFDPS
jgi:hypothetical protein